MISEIIYEYDHHPAPNARLLHHYWPVANKFHPWPQSDGKSGVESKGKPRTALMMPMLTFPQSPFTRLTACHVYPIQMSAIGPQLKSEARLPRTRALFSGLDVPTVAHRTLSASSFLRSSSIGGASSRRQLPTFDELNLDKYQRDDVGAIQTEHVEAWISINDFDERHISCFPLPFLWPALPMVTLPIDPVVRQTHPPLLEHLSDLSCASESSGDWCCRSSGQKRMNRVY